MEIKIDKILNAMGYKDGVRSMINSIRNSENMLDFDGTLEAIKTNEDLQNFGEGVMSSQTRQNLWYETLINRIGLTIVQIAYVSNPMKMFKKGSWKTGRSLQEIYADLIEAKNFDPYDAQTSLYDITDSQVQSFYHDTWRKELYELTIHEDEMSEAFTSFDSMNSFLTGLFQSVYNSYEVDEYLWTKALVESYLAKGYAYKVEVPKVVDNLTAKAFTKKTRKLVNDMTLPQGSRLYNAAGVHTRTEKRKLYLLTTTELESELGVELLAQAFHIKQVEIEARTIFVEGFSDPKVQAVLIDEDAFLIYDKVFKFKQRENEKGLYTKQFLHVHQLYSMSKLKNVVAFTSETIAPLYSIVLAPSIKGVRRGRKEKFQIFKRGSDPDIVLTGKIVNYQNQDVPSVSVEINDSVAEFEVPSGWDIGKNYKLVVTGSYPGEVLTYEGEPEEGTIEVTGEANLEVVG